MGNNKYYQELYAACNYMIDHIEKFNAYEIYKFVKYEITRGEEVALKLHNRLLAQFKFLIGESEKEPSQTDPKGIDIVPRIDYQSLKPIILAKMLAITDQFINGDQMYVNYQMSKINVDKTIPMMDYLVEQIFSADEYNKLGQWRECLKKYGVKNVPDRKEYFNILNMFYTLRRKELIETYRCSGCFDGIYEYYSNLPFYVWKQTLGRGEISDDVLCAKLEDNFNAWLCVDLGCRVILQYVVQKILKNRKNKNKLESIEKINGMILYRSKLRLKKYNSEESKKVELKKRPEKNLFDFYFYFFVRDNLLQDTKNLKKLTDLQDRDVDCIKNIPCTFLNQKWNKRSWEDIQDLFEEGYEKHHLKTFKRNVASCLLLIKKINEAVMEDNIPYSPIRLKTLYREFYLKKPKYSEGRKTGMTILNEFLKNDRMPNAEYYYIKEILNKGLFKEYGLLKEFYAKNELQENLYQLACLCLAELDAGSIVSAFEHDEEFIFKSIRDLEDECSDYAPIPEEKYQDIGDFDSPLDCNDMTDDETRNIYQLLEKLFGISK